MSGVDFPVPGFYQGSYMTTYPLQQQVVNAIDKNDPSLNLKDKLDARYVLTSNVSNRAVNSSFHLGTALKDSSSGKTASPRRLTTTFLLLRSMQPVSPFRRQLRRACRTGTTCHQPSRHLLPPNLPPILPSRTGSMLLDHGLLHPSRTLLQPRQTTLICRSLARSRPPIQPTLPSLH